MEIWHRNLLIITGFLEALLFSGCLFGWPSLMVILQEEGVYRHLCEGIDFTARFLPSTTPAEVKLSSTFPDPEILHSMVLSTTSTIPAFESHVQKFFPRGSPDCAKINLCNNSSANLIPANCDEQTVEMTLVYTTAAILYGIVAIFLGLSIQYLGLRFSRFIATISLGGGFICLAFITPEHWYLLWPSLILIAIGSNLLRFCGYQFANYWPEYSGFILTTYSCAYSISTSLFVGLQMLYEMHISMRTLFFLCGGCCALSLIPNIFIPNEAGKWILNPCSRRQDVEGEDDEASIPMRPMQQNQNVEASEAPEQNGPTMYQAIMKSICSVSGWLHMYWHFINLFLLMFYSSTFNLWAGLITARYDDASIAHFTKVLGITAFIGPLVVPTLGIFIDRLKAKAKLQNTVTERIASTMQAPTYAMFLATITLTLVMICKLFINPVAVYVSFGLIAVSRPAIIGTCISYIQSRFPEEEFQILNGFFTTAISALCFVQYPLMKWLVQSDEYYLRIHTILLIMLIGSLASPGHIMNRKVAMNYARERWKDMLEESRI